MGRLAEDSRGQAAVCSAVVDVTIDAMYGLGVLAPETVMKQALLAGVCIHAYQQVCYMRVTRDQGVKEQNAAVW